MNIASKIPVLLGASLLLAGSRLVQADGTSLPIVDFGSATSGKCVLGLIDDPEPLPSFFRGYPGGAMQIVLGPHGGVYMTVPASLSCGRGGTVPIVTWETSDGASRSVVLRYAHDGIWSEPALFTDRATEAGDPPAGSFGTVRLSRGSLRKEGNMMPSSRRLRPLVGLAPRASGTRSEDGPPSVLVSPVTGATIVVWSRRSPAGLDLVESEFANGGWSEPRVVAGSPEDERDPQLVAGPDGTVNLLYWVDGSTPRVLLRQTSGNLRTWSEAVRISGADEIASRPAGALHDGTLHVAYERHDFGLDRGPTNVVLARREGDDWISAVLAVSQSAAPLWPRSHSEQGRVWVDWDDGAGAAGWVRMDADGDWEPPRYEPIAWSEGSGGEARDGVRTRVLQLP